MARLQKYLKEQVDNVEGDVWLVCKNGRKMKLDSTKGDL